jgi:hypothetical protein
MAWGKDPETIAAQGRASMGGKRMFSQGSIGNQSVDLKET